MKKIKFKLRKSFNQIEVFSMIFPILIREANNIILPVSIFIFQQAFNGEILKF
jgi:hypothetical protein